MPIAVLCPGCKTRFEVNEKFAGKEGPCPKCKTKIKIPDAAAPEVKIHTPDVFASAGKDTKGRSLSKPIPRRETKIKPLAIWGIVLGSMLVLVVAIIGRGLGDGAKYGLISVGLLMIGPPLAVGGYFALRDDELEPYEGKELWLRAAICGAMYALTWGLYWIASGYMSGEMYQWLFVAPVFAVIGGAAAFATLDLDFGSASLHYAFFVLVTLVLRAAIGLPPVWAAIT